MTAAVWTEPQHPFEGLLDSDPQLSIDEVIVAQNQTVLVGALLGAVAVVADLTLTGAAGAGNVGAATIGSISGATQSLNGVYNIVLLATGSTAAFEVQRPDGTVDGTGKIGTPYVGSVNFTLSSAGTPTVGDSFTVTVVRPLNQGGEQFVAWSPTATDGSQVPVGITCYPATTRVGQTAKIAALRREGSWRASAINWPSGTTAGQKAFAQQQLAAKKIILL